VLGATRSCVIVQDGATVPYARAGDLALAPASTQKLLVAVAALDRLGPDFRFETTVVAPAAPQDGAVDALWFVGSGDPLIATPEYAGHLLSAPRWAGTPLTSLAALADQLAAAGVRTVRNGIHGDDSRYNGPQWLPGWKPVYRTDADIPLLSALTVDGGLDHWNPSEVIAANPTAMASVQLARLLSARGVSAAGADNQFRPGNNVVLARLTSAPLSQIVASMLRTSDNLAAELLVREIDRKAGRTGTTVGGLSAVAESLQKFGIPTAGLSQGDGSGLNPNNRASCATLLGALNMGDRPGFDSITSGLPVAARSGTMIHRLANTPLAGHLAAKTGSIDCVVGMVGHMDLKRPLRFAILVNGPCDYDAAIALEDRVALAIAPYPD
jgi:D-alanyl-D-alanine carboxypeptidase/D-alanyl-D-alanine-endopeptidase (penicillin-binding protein 4)